jgi:DNA-binding LacI/PurR family transcriptional regulator
VNSESTISAVPAVLSDNLAGGRLAAEHLLGLGHRRLAYLAAPSSDDRAVRERIEGVRAVLWDHGLSRGTLIIVPASAGVDGGAMAAVMATGADAAISALICSNDLTAIGAVRGLRSLGIRVPRQVSVVGFDDIEMAAHVDPPLTTIRQATDEMGHWAVASLLQRIDRGPEATAGQVGGTPGRTVRLPVTLVVRGSTGTPDEPL